MSKISHVFAVRPLSVAIATCLLLTACGSDDDDSNSATNVSTPTGVASLATGQLLDAPSNTSNFTAEQLNTLLGQLDPTLASTLPKTSCGVRVEYMHYDTVDVKGQKTDATGAVFIPTGSDPKCTGNRPIVLHAHGTATTKGYNIAEVGNPNNEAGGTATMMAAMFAGQGYVVVSPNYAGYDKSSLSYHPYLNAQQQSHEMADALKAGRNVLAQTQATTKVGDNGKLFLTGFSQGGHVVMATARYLEQLKEPVTASMPISGPYAMGAFGDVVFGAGKVMLGGTFFAPLMAHNYQIQYGDIYQNPSDIFATANPSETESLLPSASSSEQLMASGKLPASAMFQQAPTGVAELDSLSPSDPAFAFGFHPTNYLIKTSFRAAYLADMKKNVDWGVPFLQGMPNIEPIGAITPQNGLRKALKANDLRDYVPSMPTIMCGGNQDPTVFFDVNTSLVNHLWYNYNVKPNAQIGMVDIDITNQTTRQKSVYDSLGLPTVLENSLKTSSQTMQSAFAQRLNLVATTASQNALNLGGNANQAQTAAKYAVMTGYHSLVTPYCMGVAQTLFSQY